MIAPSTLRRAVATAVSAAACAFALFIAIDTLRAVVPLWSPLPWFDEWATVGLIRSWQDGERTAAQVLFSQHNEHRILVPRLFFFADDWLFRGSGALSLAAIVTVQFLHAGMFATVLGRSRPARAGRWAVAAAVLALMFSLRQAENFSSGFQLQFVGVFAGGTLSFLLFGLAAARERQGRPALGLLLASFAAVLVTTLTMANGLVTAYLLAALAVVARLKPRTVLACAGVALVLTVIYLQGYEAVAHHSKPSESLRHPLRLIIYVAIYLGDIASGVHAGPAIAFGLVGFAATACAAVRTIRSGDMRPGPLAMLGVMLFVAATAAVTASGRLDFGPLQALSSRYVTGSATFWAAQITYWWIDPPGLRFRVGRLAALVAASMRFGAAMMAAVLMVSVASEQGGEKPQLAVQSFRQNEAANALMLGLFDPAAMARTAWIGSDTPDLVDVLKRNRLSIFGTADFAGVGHAVTDRGAITAICDGAVSSAVADPELGPNGVRLSGTATDPSRRRLIRRVLLADAAGNVVGLASGAIPGAARDAWRGYAVAPADATLTAYGLVERARLCLIGTTTVSPAVQASQPEEAP
jgi:hypothetical protein